MVRSGSCFTGGVTRSCRGGRGRTIFPDWHQRVDRIRGGADWAVFEWTGTATFHAGEEKAGIAIQMTGATVIDVDADGKVTAWRDYLDTNEPTQQIQNGLELAMEGG